MERQNKTHVGVFEDDEIPYEVRMKYLIRAYRRDLRRIDELSQYAKGLEEENVLLQKKIKKGKVSEHISKDVTVSRMQSEINQLRGLLTKTFPQRVTQMRDVRKRMISMQEYISALQSLLTANGIAYEERRVNPSKAESIRPEKIDIFAVRGPKEKFEIEEGFCYKYPRPSVTADCVVMTSEAEPKVLLIERGDEPYKGCWAFPGGFMNMDETTEQCAVRELEEETGLRVSAVRQIGAYSQVDRDPRGRTVTVAYLAVVDTPMAVSGQDDAAKAQWFKLAAFQDEPNGQAERPELAFDHDEVMKDAIRIYNEIIFKKTSQI